MRACILVRTETGASGDVAERLRGMKGVTTAFPVFGAADVAARAEVRTRAQLHRLVAEVGTLEGVWATETLVELEEGT